jgi:Raf kinase inhibitor-like YbhB/YbcL family protein
MRVKRFYFSTAAATLTFTLAATAADAAGIFTLQSSTFQDGKMMPKKVANSQANMPANPNCVGENISPQFSWTDAPAGAKSFVFLVGDMDGRGGAIGSHWVAYGIPAAVTGFAEGEVSKASDKFVGGKNGFGGGNYFGPCPTANTSPHHYAFMLIASDFEPSDLPPGLTRDEVLAKLVPPGQPPLHTKGTTGLVGLFVVPWHE